MTRTVVICHAPADEEAARDFAKFLERGTEYSVALESGDDLLDTVESGLSGDALVALLSPAASSTRWERERWEPVFRPQGEISRAGVLLLADCRFPELLRRKNFFDARLDCLEAHRAAKIWLLSLDARVDAPQFAPARDPSFDPPVADIEALRHALSDTPGRATTSSRPLAIEFAHRHAEDFAGVFWVGGVVRSLAGLAGDLASQLGRPLDGPLDRDLADLRRFCAVRRLLIVLDGANEGDDSLAPGGKCSVLRVNTPLRRFTASSGWIEDVCGRFLAWTQDTAGCEARLAEFETALGFLLARDDAESWLLARDLGRAGFALLTRVHRMSECYQAVEALARAARARGDRKFFGECTRERLWMLRNWGWDLQAAEAELDELESRDQMSFHFEAAVAVS